MMAETDKPERRTTRRETPFADALRAVFAERPGELARILAQYRFHRDAKRPPQAGPHVKN
jgi:hypothetical protein